MPGKDDIAIAVAVLTEKIEGLTRTVVRIDKESRADRIKMSDCITENKEEIIKIKTTAKIWGAFSGVLTSIIGVVGMLLTKNN